MSCRRVESRHQIEQGSRDWTTSSGEHRIPDTAHVQRRLFESSRFATTSVIEVLRGRRCYGELTMRPEVALMRVVKHSKHNDDVPQFEIREVCGRPHSARENERERDE